MSCLSLSDQHERVMEPHHLQQVTSNSWFDMKCAHGPLRASGGDEVLEWILTVAKSHEAIVGMRSSIMLVSVVTKPQGEHGRAAQAMNHFCSANPLAKAAHTH